MSVLFWGHCPWQPRKCPVKLSAGPACGPEPEGRPQREHPGVHTEARRDGLCSGQTGQPASQQAGKPDSEHTYPVWTQN